jgi:phosphosulfolactate synthase (CoM biosynthesis protein A)
MAYIKACKNVGFDILEISSGFITIPMDDWLRLVKKVMFDAADPDVFIWYIKNYGPDVNLFVDQNQIVELEVDRKASLFT